MAEPVIYTAGGTVQAGGGLYIPRRADDELLMHCRNGMFAYVLTPRQMGKSSLMIRTAEQLIQEGIQSVKIDLTQIGTQVNAEQWYLGLLIVMEDQLMLDTDVVQWWQKHQHLGITQRLTRFFEDVLLKEVQAQIVVFVDEIDTTLRLNFTDDFFIAIRYLYNARAKNPDYKRLSFVLIGVAMPGDLIRDPQRTPFNVGQRVDLTDFTFDEALPFADGLSTSPEDAQRVLQWVLQWTGGHPYLTQRLCAELVTDQTLLRRKLRKADVDRAVNKIFLGDESRQDNNLQFVRDLLIRQPPERDVIAVLKTYQTIYRGRIPVPDEEQSTIKSHLKLSGIAKREGKLLKVRNAIYRKVFDRHWIQEHLPETLWQRLKPAMPLIVFLTSISVLMAGLTLYALKQERAAQQQNVLAQVNAVKALLLGDQRFDALIAAVQVNEQTRTVRFKLTDRIRFQALSVLSDVVHEYGTSAEFQEQNRLEGHRKAATGVVFSPDGNTIASASDDGAIKLWSRQGEELKTIPGDGGKVRSISFSPDGNTIVSGHEDGEVRLWDLQGRTLKTLEGHDRVLSVSFSPDGSLIAAAYGDGTITLWNRQGQKLKKLEEHKQLVAQVRFSPDSNTIASASKDGTIRLWNRQGEELRILRGHSAAVWGVSFSPDGKTLASASKDGTIKLWNLQGKELQTLRGHDDEVGRVIFSRDGTLIASASDDGVLKLWNRQGKEFQSIQAHRGRIWSISFSPDGNTIASAGQDGTVKLWSRYAGATTTLGGATGTVESVSFSPDGNTIASGGEDGIVKLWDRNGKELIAFKKGAIVWEVAFSPDGNTIASANNDSTVKLWNRQGEESLTLRGHEGAVRTVSFSPDGRTIASGSDDGTVKLWNRQGKELLTLKGHLESVASVSFSPDGSAIVSGSNDDAVKLWNRHGKELFTFRGHEGAVRSVSFSPDGDTIASGGDDGTVKLWNRQGKAFLTFEEHRSPVTSVSFSSDGNMIASASQDGTVKLWNRQGEELETFEGQREVWSVRFSPDGNMIASSSEDGIVRLWNLNLNDLLKWSCGWLSDYLSNNSTITKGASQLCSEHKYSSAELEAVSLS